MTYPYPYAANSQYLWPYFQQPAITPLIPVQASLPPSPNAGAGSKHIRFDASDQDTYRPRRSSWHDGMNATPSPNPAAYPSSSFIYTTLPQPPMMQAPGMQAPGMQAPMMQAPVMPYGAYTGPTHHRRLSDSALPQAAFVYPTWVYSPTVQQRPTFNPLLDGETPGKSRILFDMSSNTFEPLRISGYGYAQGTPLSSEELSQTATYPSVTRMVITCDEIPNWNVVLEPCADRPPDNSYLAVPANPSTSNTPITVSDVVFAIHRMLQRQVTHREWHDMSPERSTAIARAYTRRCKAIPNMRQWEESQGVRRVDYLLDNYMFKGLVRERGEQGFEHVKLRVGRK